MTVVPPDDINCELIAVSSAWTSTVLFLIVVAVVWTVVIVLVIVDTATVIDPFFIAIVK